MRITHVLLAAALLALLPCIGMTKAPQFPRAQQFPEEAAPVAKGDLCPCSVTGYCPCTGAHNCGCYASGKLRWVETPDPNQVALYRGATQLGNWKIAEGYYRSLRIAPDGDHWTRCECPAPVPVANASKAPTAPQPVRAPVFTPQAMYQPTQTFMPAYGPSFGGGSGRFSGGGMRGCSSGG